MVCFIHRPEYYHLYSDEKTGKDLRGLGQLIVAKHRNGATDSVWLRFIGKYAKFQNENDAYEPDEQLPPLPDPTQNVAWSGTSAMNQMSPDGARMDNGNDEVPF
jgi:replicative DNA helicase